MADAPTPTPQATPDAAPAVVPAVAQPSIAAAAPPVAQGPGPEMPADFQGGAEAWGQLDEAGKTAAVMAASDAAKAASAARTDAFAKAEGKDAKLAAYNALNADEKTAAFKAMPAEVKKELGIDDPTLPTYDLAKFTLPEGMQRDEEAIKAASDLMRGMKLTQDQAQQIIKFGADREMAAAQKSVNAFVDLQTKWTTEIKADPEIGGDKLSVTQSRCAEAIDRLNIPGLRDALNLTGAGNNPAIVRAFARVGQLFQEDKFRPGAAAPSSASDRSPNYYGDSGPKSSTP